MFKYHHAGHIVSAIRHHGTTKSYSTQVVSSPCTARSEDAQRNTTFNQGELEHRRLKQFYICTNRIRFQKQIAAPTHRQRLLNAIHKKGIEAACQRADDQLHSASAAVPVELGMIWR